MRQSNWKGYLRLSLVSVPVKAHSAANPAESFHFNQLHRECHSRIRYTKTCPVHGEVPADEIVMGYEYEKDRYVIFEKDELQQAKGDRERSINIEAVVSPDAISAFYFTEKSYYLVPDGKAGHKPFALLRQALSDEDRAAVARGVLFGREELLFIRPVEDVLGVTALKFAAEVPAPSELGEVPGADAKKEELALTKTLLKSFTQSKFSLETFADRYNERLTELVEAKVKGKEVIVTDERPERPPTINLMDALRKSLARNTEPKSKPSARTRRKSG
jgi:DNA end-binding protein Ku